MNRGRRVAVTAPEVRGPVRWRPSAGPQLAPEALDRARRIRRAQLRRAVVLLAVGALFLLGVPALIGVAPALTGIRLFGVPGAWLAVAVLPYPVMAALAWAQLAAAERVESEHRAPDADDP